MSSATTAYMLNNGVKRRRSFAPSTAPTFTDHENFLDANSLWNFGGGAFNIVGYAWTFAETMPGGYLSPRYVNYTLGSEDHIAVTKATMFRDNVADRASVADIMISNGNSYPATKTEPFTGIAGGFYKHHVSAHMGPRGLPIGGNILSKDGHATWKKFNSPPAGFTVPPGGPWLPQEDTYTMVRTLTGPYFWW